MIMKPARDIKTVKQQLQNKEYSATELVDHYFSVIKQKDKDIDAILELFQDAKESARRADELLARGEGKPLLGVPIILKDNILYKGHTASAASKMLENYKAVYSSTVVRKLQDAGAIILARANMDEFAMGSSTESSAFKVTKNPRDLSRVPGGSSGGSAAAVAAGMSVAAFGTDTGGSIRQPASFCGIVGFKPSYGAVSRFGLIAMGSSLDQAGPLTNTVGDARLLFSIVKGQDKNDATSVSDDFFAKKRTYKKVGVPRAFLEKGVSAEVLDLFEKSLKRLKDNGYEIVDIELPSFDYALAAYYIIMPAEVSTNLARFDGLRYGLFEEEENYEESFKMSRAKGFGREVKRRILLGTFALSSGYMDAYYYKAIAAREYIRENLKEVFTEIDFIATPTTPEPAFKINEKMDDPLQMYAADIFTVPVNIAKIPAISVSMGVVDKDGSRLPVGIQFMAPEFDDFNLLDFAEEFERISNYESN